MPWQTTTITQLKNEVADYLDREFGVYPQCSAWVCTRHELIEQIKKEQHFQELSSDAQQRQLLIFRGIEGRYFKTQQEVWLVYGEGDNKPTVFHELLHAIQKCTNGRTRETIVYFIVWRYLQDPQLIHPKHLAEWQEIERNEGFKAIKKRLVTEGKCDDF